VPAHPDPTNPRELQSPAVDPHPVAVLLETEGGEAVAATEPRVTDPIRRLPPRHGLLGHFDPAKERVEGLLHVGADALQDMAVDALGERVDPLVDLDRPELFVFGD